MRRRERIPPGVVDLFRRAQPLQPARYACLASDEMCAHSECDEYREIFLALHRALELGPWDESPLDAEDTDPLRAELLRRIKT